MPILPLSSDGIMLTMFFKRDRCTQQGTSAENITLTSMAKAHSSLYFQGRS